MRNSKEITYLDTFCEGGYSYKDYLEWCEEYEVGAGEEGSEDYWRWIEEEKSADVECFFANMKFSDCNGACVVCVRLGLWWGRPEIEPTKFDSLTEAIKACMAGMDAVQVWGKDGVIYAHGMHHDGSNYFEIYPLTEKGIEKLENGERISIGNHWHTGKYPKYLY